jgi:hypothetical protein
MPVAHTRMCVVDDDALNEIEGPQGYPWSPALAFREPLCGLGLAECPAAYLLDKRRRRR